MVYIHGMNREKGKNLALVWVYCFSAGLPVWGMLTTDEVIARLHYQGGNKNTQKWTLHIILNVK